MSYRRNWIAITVVIISFVMFIPLARAQEQNVDFKEAVLGKWSGTLEPSNSWQKGADIVMVIKKVDLDQKVVEVNYKWSPVRQFSGGEANVKAEYIPPDKFKWFWKKSGDYEFQLKDGMLWGMITGGSYTTKIKMKKIKE